MDGITHDPGGEFGPSVAKPERSLWRISAHIAARLKMPEPRAACADGAGPAPPGTDPDAGTGPANAAPGASLVAVAVVAGDGQPLLPCGRCRQLLLEAGGAGLLVEGPDGPVERREPR